MAPFSSGVLISLEFLSFLGIISNALCVCHVVKCFNVKKPVFLMLFIDATVSCAGCFASALCCLFLDKGVLPCFVLAFSTYTPVAVGYFITMEISVIRVYSINLSLQGIKVDETKVQKISLTLLILFILYIVTCVLTFAFNDIPFALTVETCIHGNEAPNPQLALYFIIPCVLFPIISLLTDSTMVRILKRKRPVTTTKRNCTHSEEEKTSFDTIPVRATAWSALMLIPIMVFGYIRKLSDLSKLDTVTGVFVLLLLFTVCRCSAETLISFAYKNERDSQLRKESRKMRLRKVLRDAEEEKAARNLIALSHTV